LKGRVLDSRGVFGGRLEGGDVRHRKRNLNEGTKNFIRRMSKERHAGPGGSSITFHTISQMKGEFCFTKPGLCRKTGTRPANRGKKKKTQNQGRMDRMGRMAKTMPGKSDRISQCSGGVMYDNKKTGRFTLICHQSLKEARRSGERDQNKKRK